jgi:predicted TPR repeat methyltransferase
VNKDHVRFLISGILFGFLVGYIVAYGIYEPRVKEVADAPPEAGNLGMTGAAIGPSGGGAPGGGAPAAGPAGDATMAMVLQQIADLKERLQKDPNDVEALTHLGNFFQDAGKFEQAIEYYRRALAVRPKVVDTRTDMGICLRELGKPDEAIAEFRHSLEDDPQHWQTWLNLAIVSLYDKRDPAAAASALGRVEALNPTHPGLPALREAIKQARAGAS